MNTKVGSVAGRVRARDQRRKQRFSLDAQAVEAVTRFVRVLARYGCTPPDIAAEVLKASRKVPKSWARNPTVGVAEMDAAAHAVTIWFSDPTYLDSSGNPKPLSLEGSAPSLTSLLRRVDRGLHPPDVLRHLLRRQVVRRIGRRYVPRGRVVSFRGSGAPYHSRSVRSLLLMLRTLEHNSEPERSTPGWFEVFAMNTNFPLKAREAFDRRVRRDCMGLLMQLDADMHRRERSRKPGERTVPLGIGIYRFELPKSSARPSRRRRK